MAEEQNTVPVTDENLAGGAPVASVEEANPAAFADVPGALETPAAGFAPEAAAEPLAEEVPEASEPPETPEAAAQPLAAEVPVSETADIPAQDTTGFDSRVTYYTASLDAVPPAGDGSLPLEASMPTAYGQDTTPMPNPYPEPQATTPIPQPPTPPAVVAGAQPASAGYVPEPPAYPGSYANAVPTQVYSPQQVYGEVNQLSGGMKFGWLVVGLLMGIPGMLIAWLANADKHPQVKKDAILWSVIGFAVNAIFAIIVTVTLIGVVAAGASAGASYYGPF